LENVLHYKAYKVLQKVDLGIKFGGLSASWSNLLVFLLSTDWISDFPEAYFCGVKC